MAIRDHSWESVICGHHAYKAIWIPDIGEILDFYAISMVKDDTIVGHVPHEKSCVA